MKLIRITLLTQILKIIERDSQSHKQRLIAKLLRLKINKINK